jgi:CubicO group peptidase (beta-lactamase class C family)
MSLNARIDPAALDELFAPYDRTDAPGFAVGVALHGTPRYRRGFGMASIELPIALSPTIRMRIGSTSKHFCALAVMLLAEQGKLSAEDSVRTYVPELPPLAQKVTLRQLMTHTGGMRDSLDLLFHALGPGIPVPTQVQLAMLSAIDSVNFSPGTDWNYNNGGYTLLSEVVARVSGADFGEFLKSRVFEPAGMYDTLLRERDTDLVPNTASLHVPKAEGGYTRGIFGPAIRGEGGIVSTVDDMLKWLRHMSSPTVGSAETWKAMRTPNTTHGYGLGLLIDEHRGQRTVHHAGGVIGGSSQMIKFVDQDLDIILITNGRSALDMYRLVDAIADRCIPGLPPAPQDLGGSQISGNYYSPTSGRVLSLIAHEGRQAVVMGGMTLPVVRDSDGAIKVPIVPTDLVIQPCGANDSTPAALEITEVGRRDRLELIQAPTQASAARLAGEYSSASAGLEASITTARSGPARMRLQCGIGGLDYELTPMGPDLWEAKSTAAMPLSATIEVRAGGFDMSTGRTLRLHFDRV